MSEAMTNSEIEDVLSSVRRLVAQEGRRPEPADPRATQLGRLVLTQAQRVPAEAEATPKPDVALPTPDFRELEATIAELEAAVSASNSAFDADGQNAEAEDAAEPASNVTELYGKLSFVRRAMEARRAANDPVPAPEPAAQAEAPGPAPEPAPEPVVVAEAPQIDTRAGAPVETEDQTDFDPDDFLIEEAIIDEAMLRRLVEQLVREELQGQLGERITLQVRKLVRAEVARALDERKLL